MIHSSSIISPQAEIHKNVVIGPFCVIEGNVKIDEGTVVDSHVRLGSKNGRLVLGKNNHIYAGAAVGGAPQDLKYKGEETSLVIGDGNQIRECATINIGTVGGGGETKIGNNNLFMAYSHIGHDCIIGDKNIIANAVNIAGHVSVENNVTIGGMVGISQFTRMGAYAFIGGYSSVSKDILPFSIATGNYAVIRATNKIGMERAGFSKEDIQVANQIIRIFSKSNATREEALNKIQSEIGDSVVKEMILEYLTKATRGLAI